MRISLKKKNGEKTDEKPAVNLSSVVLEIPKPILSLKRSRKSVEAKHSDKLSMVIAV
jgi:hypothetical protein